MPNLSIQDGTADLRKRARKRFSRALLFLILNLPLLMVAVFNYHRTYSVLTEVAFAARDKQLALDVMVYGILIIFNSIGAVFLLSLISRRKKAEETAKRAYDELKMESERQKKFNRATIGRELEMIKLKREVNALLEQTGKPRKYHAFDKEELL